ncbi:MAG: VWA domain-containing protein, partial [Planctomycetaceae bacterium]|nr:VWA domain-containing protein [Planctomycetaceae bacterium]
MERDAAEEEMETESPALGAAAKAADSLATSPAFSPQDHDTAPDSLPLPPGEGGGGPRGKSPGSMRPRESGTPPVNNNMEVTRKATDGRQIRSVNLLPGEELWVIATSPVDGATPEDPRIPRCGTLMATRPETTEVLPVPLKHTDVQASIDGYIATVGVTQQFHNPYESRIEAEYIFPLPQNAAVNEFVMTIGERKIRGVIREREEAIRIHNTARAQGHVSALLQQERPNIFTQKVANIEPGHQIDINIRYFHTLQYDDGAYEFVFPMVVGPRFNPAGTSDGVGAVPSSQPGSSGQPTEVAYLTPQKRSGHDIAVTVNLNAGLEVGDVRSINHEVELQTVSECQRRIVLSAKDSIPNRDFVLRYSVAGDQIRSAMLTHEDSNGKYFTMMICPPAELSRIERSPMEMVFVLDCSGSMRGRPLEQAKQAVEYALSQLTPRDTFQIIQFSNSASQLGTVPIVATPENLQRGLTYLRSLNGSGGTQMIEGLCAALDFPHDEGRFRLVTFLTDGFIGNEQQILEAVSARLGDSRIFSFGVGTSTNRFLMDRMAILGRGAVSYLSLNEDAVGVMSRFEERISHPALTDLALDFGEMEVMDVYPPRLPDLVYGRPVVITGQFRGRPSAVTVNGRAGMKPVSYTIEPNAHGDSPDSHPGIAAVWARMKIRDLMLQTAQRPEESSELQKVVTETALNHNLMSSFTSFVAVDSLSRTEGDFGTTIKVPVPLPEGVRYDTTVGQ